MASQGRVPSGGNEQPQHPYPLDALNQFVTMGDDGLPIRGRDGTDLRGFCDRCRKVWDGLKGVPEPCTFQKTGRRCRRCAHERDKPECTYDGKPVPVADNLTNGSACRQCSKAKTKCHPGDRDKCKRCKERKQSCSHERTEETEDAE